MVEKKLIDVERDAVGKIAEKYMEKYNVIENAKASLADIEKELIVELRKARRQEITLQVGKYNSVTLQVALTSAKEKIRVKK